MEGVTGWAIGVDDGLVQDGVAPDEMEGGDEDATALYDKLDEVVAEGAGVQGQSLVMPTDVADPASI